MELEQYFVNGFDFVVIPKAVMDVPIELSKMKREDDSYHTINTLSEVLGTLFVPTAIIDERFVVIHYGFDRNGEEQLFHTFLQSKGLVNMRGELQGVEEIDFGVLNGNEYGIFSALEVQHVPQVAVEV